MQPTIRPATAQDVVDLAPRLRPADANEFLANGRTPSQGLNRALGLSALALCIEAPGERPLSVFGFAQIDANTGCPWLAATEELVTTHRGWFLRNSHRIIGASDHLYPRLFNRVDARNSVHVRWLRWVGCEVGAAVPFGPFGLPFHPFFRTTSSGRTISRATGA